MCTYFICTISYHVFESFLLSLRKTHEKSLLLGIYISGPKLHKSQDNITKLIASSGFCTQPLTDEICYSLLITFTNETFPIPQNYTCK